MDKCDQNLKDICSLLLDRAIGLTVEVSDLVTYLEGPAEKYPKSQRVSVSIYHDVAEAISAVAKAEALLIGYSTFLHA